ncbi:hypothetical protein [Methanobacterium sp.]|uniref:hypothetical protein n=1 Tax=Methanobacterium sp. TaxID=2164 RepID=UPI0031588E26
MEFQPKLTSMEKFFIFPIEKNKACKNYVFAAAKRSLRKCATFSFAGGNLFPRPQKPLVFAGIKNFVFDS